MRVRKDGLKIECNRLEGLCKMRQDGLCFDASGPCGSMAEKRAAHEKAQAELKNAELPGALSLLEQNSEW
jgi:hypothetical protein